MVTVLRDIKGLIVKQEVSGIGKENMYEEMDTYPRAKFSIRMLGGTLPGWRRGPAAAEA